MDYYAEPPAEPLTQAELNAIEYEEGDHHEDEEE